MHICVETKRNVKADTLNDAVTDLCLTVWLCPLLTNAFPCSSQNYGDDMWSRLVFASKDDIDVFSGIIMRVVLWITAEGWWKQKNQISLEDVKWDVVLVAWSTFRANVIQLIITVRLYHMCLFRLLLSSITEETIWGNNGPCSFPVCQFSAILVAVSMSYGILEASIVTFITHFITYLRPSASHTVF